MPRRDRLAEYEKKRDFTKTREPPPGARARAGAGGKRRPGFFIQKHDARRLHYDLRLEWKGVLLSWAVAKGPSPDPGQRRLAVRTEDHPLSYAEFEGTIPKGEYGGGTVMLWDKGTWEPQDDPDRSLEKGKLRFVAHGERMRAGWVLVRMRGRPKEKRENWLLIKERDDEASEDENALTRHYTKSIATERSMSEIAAGERPDGKQRKRNAGGGEAKSAGGGKTKRARGKTGSGRPPPFVAPQLATLTDEVPAGDAWLHEMKFDGYRCLVAVGGGKSICYTRSGLDWTDKFRDVAAALSGLDCESALLDGEIVAIADGGSRFSALQAALSAGRPTEYRAFDLLHRDGQDLRPLPLIERKEALRDLLATLPDGEPVHFSEHVRGHGARVFEEMCRNGEEGVIAKKADAPYAGRRTRSWLKIKCRNRQEFVIGGYKRSDKRGRPFSSLLLGAFEGERFVYRGRVGTGFSEDLMHDLAGKLKKLERKSSPFTEVSTSAARNAVWVTPRLVAEVDYSELTAGGHVRHGSFLGLREDKQPAEVTMEKPVDETRESPDEAHGVRLTNPDRVLYEGQGVTKADLVRYYGAVALRMLPLMERHPLSLVRCPKGAGEKCFFQKHASDGFPEALKKVPIRESSGKAEDYLYVDDVAGLVAGVQMGTLEFHIWGSRTDSLEKPDRIVFDLDPDERLTFEVVRLAAVVVRDRLRNIGLETLPLVTGGKGVHVVAPLRRNADWERVKGFARGFAQAIAAEHPDVFTATMAMKHRQGKIFLDWMRNERGSTAIAPWSTRAKPDAPVAVPVSWKELAGLDSANAFGIEEAMDRMAHPDPWSSYGDLRRALTKKMEQAV